MTGIDGWNSLYDIYVQYSENMHASLSCVFVDGILLCDWALSVYVDGMCIEGFLVQLRHAGIPDGGGRSLCQ